MFFETLDKIRIKPKHVRERYAFGSAFVFTAILVVVWLVSLPASFSNISGGVESEAVGVAPFSGFLTQIKNQFEGAKKSVANVWQSASTTLSASVATSTTVSKSSGEEQNQSPIEIMISSSTNMNAKSTTTKTIQIGTTNKPRETVSSESRLPYLEPIQ